MSRENRSRYYYLMLLVSPAITVYLAIRNLNWNKRKGVFIMAITLFGGTLFLSEAADGFRLREDIYDHYMGMSFGLWFSELLQILQFKHIQGVKGDVYSHFFSYLIGHIMGIPSQYFVFVSFVFGYFYVSSMSEILKWDKGTNKSLLFWSLVFIFITYRFLDTIQSVRTWTGAWVLFYGVYRYHLTKKIKYLWIICAAPIFHIAYFVIALPALGIVFAKRFPPKLFLVVYILSFSISVNADAILERVATTEVGAKKIDGYITDDPDQDRLAAQQAANFYLKYGKGWALKNAPHIVIGVLVFFGLFSARRMNSLELGVFSTGILMATMANLGSFVGVFYNRTMANAGIYILATLMMLLIRGELLNATGAKLLVRKTILWGVVIVFVPYLIFVASNMAQFTSVFMFAGPIIGFVEDINLSVRQLLGILFLD